MRLDKHWGFLCHHGVKGQKWGVKNGPPYPIDQKVGKGKNHSKDELDKDIRVAKGTKVKHISDKADIDLRNSPIHISYKEWDNLVYKGAFATGKMIYEGAKSIFEHTYTVTEELVSPSKKKRVDIFMELVKDNKVRATKDLETIERDNRSFGVSRKKSSKPFSKMNDKELRNEGYKTFVSGFEDREKYKITKQYIDKMKKKSYNALVDDNNIKVYNEVKSPMLVLDAKKSLRKEGNGRRVFDEEIEQTRKKVEKQLSKKGKKLLE
ncbi:hypothetical protein AALC25_00130 [Lachnospiraceae bacterium 29-84]